MISEEGCVADELASLEKTYDAALKDPSTGHFLELGKKAC